MVRRLLRALWLRTCTPSPRLPGSVCLELDAAWVGWGLSAMGTFHYPALQGQAAPKLLGREPWGHGWLARGPGFGPAVAQARY